MIRRFWNTFLTAIKSSLRQGITPEQLALTITLGMLFGIIPVIGITTVVLALIAFRFKLNMIVIQLANYAVYPLQLLLLIPFYKAGQWIFNGPQLASGYMELYAAFVTHPFSTLYHFWQLTIQGTLVWFVFSIPAGFLLFYGLCMILQKMRVSGTTTIK